MKCVLKRRDFLGGVASAAAVGCLHPGAFAAEGTQRFVILDIGGLVRFPSHPEIGGKRTVDEVRETVRKLRAEGREPVPMLDFESGRDAWIGSYHALIATKRYHEFCADVIGDAVRLFDRPKYVFLGYGFEDWEKLYDQDICVCRQNETWWNDLKVLVEAVEGNGATAWLGDPWMLAKPHEVTKRLPNVFLATAPEIRKS